jgi:hypothetical protein
MDFEQTVQLKIGMDFEVKVQRIYWVVLLLSCT